MVVGGGSWQGEEKRNHGWGVGVGKHGGRESVDGVWHLRSMSVEEREPFLGERRGVLQQVEYLDDPCGHGHGVQIGGAVLAIPVNDERRWKLAAR